MNTAITTFVRTTSYDVRDVREALDFAAGLLNTEVQSGVMLPEVLEDGIIGRAIALEPTSVDLQVLGMAVRRRFNASSKQDAGAAGVLQMFARLQPKL